MPLKMKKLKIGNTHISEGKNPIKIAAKFGSFSSEILKQKEKISSPSVIEAAMDKARHLYSKGVLKREKRGIYALNLKGRQKDNEKKFRQAIKLGSQVDITFVNSNNEITTRRCTPSSVSLTNDNNIILCFADQKRNAYRSARLDRVKKVSFIK